VFRGLRITWTAILKISYSRDQYVGWRRHYSRSEFGGRKMTQIFIWRGELLHGGEGTRKKSQFAYQTGSQGGYVRRGGVARGPLEGGERFRSTFLD